MIMFEPIVTDMASSAGLNVDTIGGAVSGAGPVVFTVKLILL
jgi:hypothetical protein